MTRKKSSLKSRIQTAMDNAAPMYLEDGTWILADTEEAHKLFDMTDLTTKPKDHPVHIDVQIGRLPAYFVATQSAEELGEILDIYLSIVGDDLSPTERASEIQHELEHGEAAMLLGAESATYYLAVHASEDQEMLGWQLGHCAQGLHTTKLGLVTLVAHPTEPSDSDIYQLGTLGYSSVAEVAKLAAEHSLPIPLSAR